MNKSSIKRIGLVTLLIFAIITIYTKCSFHRLPKEKLSSIKLKVDEQYDSNQFMIILRNPVYCPSRLIVSSTDEEVNKLLQAYSPVQFNTKSDTTVITIRDKGDLSGTINYAFKWGNPGLPIHSKSLEKLPFPTGKKYQLLQGNNSTPTHNTTNSRYAFDFTMKTGDTITSSQNGYVVTVVDGYHGWGYSDKWKSYGNQVMIYDTTSNLFTMYGHLKQHGSLVQIGDYVRVGQPIALSGQTGQTSEEHLHFNVFQAYEGKGGIKSYPLDSIGPYKVEALKRHQWMSN